MVLHLAITYLYCLVLSSNTLRNLDLFGEVWWVLPSGSKSNKVGRYFYLDAKSLDEVIVLQALDAGTNWAVVTNKCCC